MIAAPPPTSPQPTVVVSPASGGEFNSDASASGFSGDGRRRDHSFDCEASEDQEEKEDARRRSRLEHKSSSLGRPDLVANLV